MATRIPKIGEELPSYAKIGIESSGAGCQITPGTGEMATQIVFDSPEGAVRFDIARYWAGQTYDYLANAYFNRLDEAIARPWALAKEDVLRYLAPAKLEIRVDETREFELQEQARRATAHYSRWIPNINVALDGKDAELRWTFSAGTIDKAEFTDVMHILRELGWKLSGEDGATKRNSIYRFAVNDLCEAATKRDTLLGWNMGLGKTRAALAISEIHRFRDNVSRTVVVALRQHLLAWQDEFPLLDPLIDRYGKDYTSWWIEKTHKPDPSKPFLLVSLERVQHMTEAEQMQLKMLSRDAVIICDEIYILQNKNTKRFKNMMNFLIGKHHIALSGTLIRGHAIAALAPLAWTFRSGSPAFPNYRIDRQGAERAFADRFGMRAQANDGTSKKVAVLNDEQGFMAMLRPLMTRALRHEPRVVEELGDTPMIREMVDIQLDEEHKAFYAILLDQFRAWYKRILIRRGEPGKISTQEILVKLTYLKMGLAQPWKMPDSENDEEFSAPSFPCRPTALHQWTINKVREVVADNRQVICFSEYPDVLDACCKFISDIPSGVLHGKTPQSERPEILKEFRNGAKPVLWLSTGVGAASLNLGQASVCIIMDPNWTPSIMDQAEGRMTRGMVAESPYAYRLTSTGTLYEYIHQNGEVKKRAMDAALDHIAQTTTGSMILDTRAYAYGLVFPDSLAYKFGQPRTYILPTDGIEK